MTNERHDIAVILACWAEHTYIAVVAKRATETADDEADVSAAANGVFGTNIDTKWLVRCGLTEPWFEVIKKVCHLLHLVPTDELWLTKKVTQAAYIQLIANSRKAKIVRKLNKRIDCVANGALW